MALFGTDMVQVTTPDGRTLTVPQQLAAQFPGLQPAPAAQQSIGPALGGMQPGGLAAPTAAPAFDPVQPPSPPPDPGPITAPSQSAPSGPTSPAPRGPVTSPGQVPEPGPTNTPKPPTDADLAKQGVAGQMAASDAAYQRKEDATGRLAQVDADTATQVGNAMATRDAEQHAKLVKLQQDAEANQKQLDSAMQDRMRAAKALADKKIDRSADHPVLSAISIVLGAIGSAMVDRDNRLSAAFAHTTPPPTGDNPALKMFYAQIDRKVAAQMQDIEQGRLNLGEMDKNIAAIRANGADKLAIQSTLRDAALQQATREIDTLQKKMENPRAIAAGDVAKASIAAERAKADNEFSNTAWTRIQTEQQRKDAMQMHRESLGVQYAGQAQAERHFNKTFDEQKRQFDIKEANDLEAVKLAHPGKVAAAAQAALKDNEERAVGDPANGSYLLQPEGAKARADADTHDKTAEQFRTAAQVETDPNKRQSLAARADAEAQKASELRIESSTTGTWRVGKDERKEVSSLASTAQTIASTADEIKLLRDKYGNEFTSSAAKAEMQEKSTALLMYLKNAWKLGVLSGSDADYIESATGGDPSKLTASDVSSLFGSPDKAARLDSLVSGVEQMTRNELKGKGFRGEFKVKRDTAANPTPEGQAVADSIRGDEGKTPGEEVAGAQGRIADKIDPRNTGAAIWGEGDVTRRREREAEAKGSGHGSVIDIPGLTDTQAKAVEANILAYKQNAGATDEASQSRAKKASDVLLGLATSDRRSLSSAVLDALGEHAPELQKQAIARLPKPVAQQRAGYEQAAIGAAPVGILKQNAIGGDEASKQELGRRGAAGDKEALRAIQDLINARKVR